MKKISKIVFISLILFISISQIYAHNEIKLTQKRDLNLAKADVKFSDTSPIKEDIERCLISFQVFRGAEFKISTNHFFDTAFTINFFKKDFKLQQKTTPIFLRRIQSKRYLHYCVFRI